MRPSRDQMYMEMAQIIATRTTCLRRAVGCVLTDKDGHVLATGYNGVAAGLPHCNKPELFNSGEGAGYINHYPHKCSSADAESGQGLDECKAIHAEQNALLQCKDVREIETCYTTAQPCVHCTKLLLNTGCKRIVYLEAYTHRLAENMWRDSGRKIEQFPSNQCASCTDCKSS